MCISHECILLPTYTKRHIGRYGYKENRALFPSVKKAQTMLIRKAPADGLPEVLGRTFAAVMGAEVMTLLCQQDQLNCIYAMITLLSLAVRVHALRSHPAAARRTGAQISRQEAKSHS
jgi:hypothetical protein